MATFLASPLARRPNSSPPTDAVSFLPTRSLRRAPPPSPAAPPHNVLLPVIGHQAQGVHLPAGLAASFAQGVDEPLPIRVIAENGFAPVAAIHPVIYRARVLNAKLSRHAETRIKNAIFSNC